MHKSHPIFSPSNLLYWFNWIVFLILAIGLGWVVINEIHSSTMQAHYFSNIASKLDFTMGKGASTSIRFPKFGPYDKRLGYCDIPDFSRRLQAHGYVITEQARMSPTMLLLQLPPIYPEKDQAGLSLLGRDHRLIYSVRSPERIYGNFDSIPRLLTQTLLFIEDRELLDSRYPMRNPAVNWSRLSRAIFDQAIRIVDPGHKTPGASTLATQIEKYRHSPNGRTASIREKFSQMESASIRSYLKGENNLDSRRRIVVTYLNTVPLTAKKGFGEINGLGDGMWAWYGRDFPMFNEILRRDDEMSKGQSLRTLAETYKQALSLMIAQRRPAYFLQEGSPILMQMTNRYLHLLEADRIISPALLHAALPLPLHLNHGPMKIQAASFVSHKAANLLRTDLSSLLHMPRLYDLDRLDLTAYSTLDADTQQMVSAILQQVRKPDGAREAGLYGHNMFAEHDDPSRLSYSFTLFERQANANVLRVQTDDLDQPFNINSGARLNLGSTSKLRTLISYLEIIAELHNSYANMSKNNLEHVHIGSRDVLSQWAITYFMSNPGSSLWNTLDAAMMRTYSGDPSEIFFTGGGMQKFTNFEPAKDDGIMTVRAGFQNSVNLVFVRLMRDIVHYYEYKTSFAGMGRLEKGDTHDLAAKPTADPMSASSIRKDQLIRFADMEGRKFLAQFYKKYKGKTAVDAVKILIGEMHANPRNLSIVFRSVEPDATLQQYLLFMREQLPGNDLGEKTLQYLYDKFSIDNYSLNDRGYLIGVHPLELWLVGYLVHNPNATLSQVLAASQQQRQEVYAWLFKTHDKKTQEMRIRQMMEIEAFQKIAADWHNMGYPFESLTPSYATALGASGDRPDSLAKLMGIIVNRGLLMPTTDLQGLKFAKATPYETEFAYKPSQGVRVLPEEITRIVRRSLLDVVQGGTGYRLKNGFPLDNGQEIAIGGKTGTGDQRFVTYASDGKLLESRAVNRSATFVFLIGDRFFGTITAYVHEPYAADYTFTSALTVQLLKSLVPVLEPIVLQDRHSLQVH
jgi:membrane peptidoglycan carboxypeptidase